MTTVDVEWAERIGRHLLPDGSVVVPPRIAKWLDRQANMHPERRQMLRTTDVEAYEVLMALHMSALGYSRNAARAVHQPRSVSANGHKPPGCNRFGPQSQDWLTTAEAATLTGVHERTIRRWARARRMPAHRHGGRWLIDRKDINIVHALAA